MKTITIFPSYDITVDTNMSHLRMQLQAQAHAASGPIRALLRVFDDDVEQSIHAQLVDVCFELPRTFELEVALLMDHPRKAMGPLSQIRQIRRIYIDSEGTYGPVERGDRDHLADTMPSFFAYGYETGVRVPAKKMALDIATRLKDHLYYVYIDGMRKTAIQALHQQYPTLQLGVQLADTPARTAHIASAVAAGVRTIYMPIDVWTVDADIFALSDIDVLEESDIEYSYKYTSV